MPLIDHLPRSVRSAVGESFAPRLEIGLSGEHAALPAAMHIGLDRAKAGELLMSAGMRPFQAENTVIRVIADADKLPRRLRRQVRRGETTDRVFVTHREERGLFRPFNPGANEITVNLTSIPDALSQSMPAIERQEATLQLRRYQGPPEEGVHSTRESLEQQLEDEIGAKVVMEAKRLAHEKWHHRLRPVVGSLLTGSVFGLVGRTVAAAVDGGVSPERIPHLPVSWQGLASFTGGVVVARLWNRFVSHPRHVAKTNREVALYKQRHGADRIVQVALQSSPRAHA